MKAYLLDEIIIPVFVIEEKGLKCVVKWNKDNHTENFPAEDPYIREFEIDSNIGDIEPGSELYQEITAAIKKFDGEEVNN
jgi:hypothetical protein